VLSRFLGLEFLRKKEESAKEIYSDFSKSMMSNVYNTETLKQNNEENTLEIETLNTQIESAQKNIVDVDNRLQKGQEYKDNLLKSKFSDLDQELVILNPVKLQDDINS
ncbi:MAG: hypothetical protein ACK55Z_09415, partial [bacterium]